MSQLEPMTVEEIKELWEYRDINEPGNTRRMARLTLAWVEAEAKLRYWPKRWLTGHSLELYRNEVLAEIGWPKDER